MLNMPKLCFPLHWATLTVASMHTFRLHKLQLRPSWSLCRRNASGYTLAPCCTILLFFNLWLQLLKVFICLNILTFSINPKPLGFKLCGGPLLLLFPFYISMFVGATAWVCDIIYKPGVSSIPWIYTSPLDILLVRRGGDWKIHTPGSMIGGFKPEWPTTVWWAGSTSAGKSIHFSPYYR